eukprot:1157647-Pelagomonas_calceolata.AAC.2
MSSTTPGGLWGRSHAYADATAKQKYIQAAPYQTGINYASLSLQQMRLAHCTRRRACYPGLPVSGFNKTAHSIGLAWLQSHFASAKLPPQAGRQARLHVPANALGAVHGTPPPHAGGLPSLSLMAISDGAAGCLSGGCPLC